MNSWTIGRSSIDFNKLVPQHSAVAHLGCIQRLGTYCGRLVQNLMWRYDKSITNIKLPVAYFRRVVLYTLKLVQYIKKQEYQALGLKGLRVAHSDNSIDDGVKSLGSISLVKAYTVEELLKVIFPASKQSVDSLMNFTFFVHSEGVKMLPKLDKSYSSCTKASSNLEPESTVCHEDEALLGDLFCEVGRSVGSMDGYDQSVIAASSHTHVNMPLHAAAELFIFLKTKAFSPVWTSSIYEHAHIKLTTYLLVMKAKEVTSIQAEVRFDGIKTDRVFSSFLGQCDVIYGSLSDGLITECWEVVEVKGVRRTVMRTRMLSH